MRNQSKNSKQSERMKNAIKPDWVSGVNMIQMLRSQKYRLEIAIRYTSNSKDAAELLGISERTYFRWKKIYNIKGH